MSGPGAAAEGSLPGPGEGGVELSVVIPCLNESETLGGCIEAAREGLAAAGISGEIVVADNGSTDGSASLARGMGARVVPVPEPGYGSALMGGIAAARGRYVIMGDADGSYDFREIPRFVDKLRDGCELVMGCRLARGGGKIEPGAMPPLHRWLGNPLFSFMARAMFRGPVNDIYCGLRAFSKTAYEELGLRCTGMEFATEMAIKSSLAGQKIGELPITLHVDGRVKQTPHLRTFRDGWRTLRFLMLFSPRWLFLVPGLVLVLIGLLGFALAMPGATIAGVTLDAHTLLFASLALLLGSGAIQVGVFARTFSAASGLLPTAPALQQRLEAWTVERGLVAGVLGALGGLVLLGLAVNRWRLTGFGPLDYAETMRLVIPGFTLVALGFQTVWSSFFLGLLRLARR